MITATDIDIHLDQNHQQNMFVIRDCPLCAICRHCGDHIVVEFITGTRTPVPTDDGVAWMNADEETWCATEDPTDPDGFAEHPHTPED